MRDDYRAFRNAGAEIVVVTRHDAKRMRTYWAENKLKYLGIPDPKGTLTKRYGQQWQLFKLGRMPAQFVIDCQGKLAHTHYGSSMSDIPENAKMLKLLQGLPRCTTPRATPPPMKRAPAKGRTSTPNMKP